MARIFFISTFIFVIFISTATSFDLNCRFESTNGYAVIGRVYICVSSGINMFNPESARIGRMIGSHEAHKSNDAVEGFHANRQVVNYFPQGLDSFFPNLQSIAIWRCGLKEIHQSDLKPFPGLRSINMYDNKLQVLEQGLMDFNPNLEVVAFHGNRLVHVDPNVFDNLNKMTDLYFEGVPCIDKNTLSREESLSCIQKMKTQCVDAEFVETDKQVRNLINESEILSPEEFNEKLDKMNKVVSDYEFSEYRPLSDSIKNLRSLKMDIPTPKAIENVTTGTTTTTECSKTDQDPAVDMEPEHFGQENPKMDVPDKEVSDNVTEAAESSKSPNLATEATTSTTEATTSTTEAAKSSTEAITSTEAPILSTEAPVPSTEAAVSSDATIPSTKPSNDPKNNPEETTTQATWSPTEATRSLTEAIVSTEASIPSTQPTVPSTEPTKLSTEASVPTKMAISSTEPTDDPKNAAATPSTQATVPTTETPTPSTEATLSSTQATITSSTEASNPSTEPTNNPKNDQEPPADINLPQEITDLVTGTLTNINNIKMVQDATDDAIKELKEAQDATKSHVESIDEKIKAIEAQVDERFAALDKKLDSILRALRIGE